MTFSFVQVLYDIGVVSTKEPFQCVINQGIILGEVSIYLLNPCLIILHFF